MKSTLKRFIAISIVSIMIFCALPLSGWAAGTHVLYVSPVRGNTAADFADAMPISAVKWYKSSNTFYLLLPTEARGKLLQLWFDGSTTVTVDEGDPIELGGSTRALTAGTHIVRFGNTPYTVEVMYSKNIGAMYITTDTGSLDYVHASKDNKDKGDMQMVNADGTKIYYDNRLTQMKGRGNATWNKPKKPYQIKTDKKVELVEGAGKHKTWLLMANYGEQTMVRNSFVYDLANDVSATANNPMMQFVDLYCNYEYQGTYSVCEKVEIGDNRIEINDLEGATEDANPDVDLDSFDRFGPNVPEQSSGKGYKIPNDPEDITGGYLLEVESHPRYQNEVSGFVTSRGQAMVIKEPEYASEAQVAYISNYFQEFEDALYSADGINPKTGKRYDEYFDLSSLARKYIIEELTRNIDANMTSQFYYKPADGEAAIAYCAPVWDYDNSLGNYNNTRQYEGWTAANKSNNVDGQATYETPYRTNCKYYGQMKTHQSFMNAVIAEWNGSFLPIISEALGTADDPNTYTKPLSFYTTHLGTSAQMNHVVWNTLTALNIQNLDTGGPTYKGTIDYLKSYIKGRSEWMTSQWPLSNIKPLATTAGNNTLVSMTDYDSSATYYTVSNEAELRKFSDLVNGGTSFEGKTVLQTADITLTQLSGSRADTHNRIGKVPNGENPVSSSTAPHAFRGTYNGGGYKIYNVVVDRENRSGVGLFGAAYGATFIDVHVASGHLTGGTRVGGICGMADACTFIRCSNAATVEVTGYSGNFTFNGTDAAGIAGIAREGGTFISCYNTGLITGVTGLAGICGHSNFGVLTVTNCYNTGIFTFTGTVEGSPIARQAGDGTSYPDCYSLAGATPEEMTDKHTTPTFTAEELENGTLLSNLNAVSNVWQAGEEGPVHKPVVTTETIPVTVVKKIGDQVLSENVSYYEDGDSLSLELSTPYYLESVTVNGIPTTETALLISEPTTVVYQLKKLGKPISELGEAGGYYITDTAGLTALLQATATQNLAGYTFYLMQDVDASSVTLSGGTFAGTLNGKGSTITGLAQPLFQTVTHSGKVTKLTLQNATVKGSAAVADVNHGVVSYIDAKNLVITGNQTAGGIVNTNEGFIFSCTAENFVVGTQLAGGIAATNRGSIRNCLNVSRIVADQGTVGGIAAAGKGGTALCISRGILNAPTLYAIAPGGQADCTVWDQVRGDKGDAETVNDLTLRSADFADAQNKLFWTAGLESPVPTLPAGELGDVTNDDAVNVLDALILLRHLAGSADQVNVENADLVEDPEGTLTTNDASALLSHLLWSF